MDHLEILADAYDCTKHVELSIAHGLPMCDVMRQLAALRALLLPFRRVDNYPPLWVVN